MLMSILKTLWSFLIKDFLAGVLLTSLKDIGLKLVEKTPWAVILERFLTRLLVVALKWLSTLTTNSVASDTINDFLAVLKGNGLKEANPIPKGAVIIEEDVPINGPKV